MVTAERLSVVVDSDGTSGVVGGLTNIREAALSTKGAVGAMGGALAALSAGAMAKSVSVAADFQDAMIQVQKVTDPKTMRVMSKEIRNMAETIPLAQNELAKITEDAARFGIRGKKNLSQFTETVAKMVNATDLGANEAGEAFAKLATLTGMPISKVGNLGSAINSLSNTAATSSKEIVDSMMRAAGTLASTGMNERQIAGLSATLNEVSESSERAGTRLRRLGQEALQATGKKAQIFGEILYGQNRTVAEATQKYKQMAKSAPVDMLRKLAQMMKKGGQKADSLNAALSTTSRQALSGLAQNLDGLNKNLRMSQTAFDKNTSLQREFAAQSKTLNNQVQLLKNRITNVAISIGNVLLPPLTKVVKWVSAGISAFSKFNSKLGGVPATVALLTSFVTGLTAAIAAFGPTIAAATPALSTLVFAFGGLLAPIAAVTAAAIALQQDFGGLRTSFVELASYIQRRLGTTLKFLKILVTEVIGTFTSVFSKGATNAESSVARITSSLKTDLFFTFTRVFDQINATLIGAIKWWRAHGRQVTVAIRNGIGGAMLLLGSLVKNAATTVRSLTSGMTTVWTSHQAQVTRIVRKMAVLLRKIFQGLATAGMAILRPFLNKAQSFWQSHGAQVTRIVTKFTNVVITLITKLSNVLLPIIRTFTSLAGTAWSKWGDELVAVARFIASAISGIFGTFLDGLETTLDIALAAMNGNWGRVLREMRGFAHRTFSGLLSFVRKWGSGLVNAISGALSNVLGGVRSWGRDVLRAVNNTLSSLTHAANRWISNFTKPFREAKQRVLDEFNQLKHEVVGNSIVPDMLDMTIGVADKWKRPFTKPFRDAKSRVLGEFDKLKKKVGRKTDQLRKAAKVKSIDQIVNSAGEFSGGAAQKILNNMKGGNRWHKLADKIASKSTVGYNYVSGGNKNPFAGDASGALSALKGLASGQWNDRINQVYDALASYASGRMGNLYDQIPHMSKGGSILSEGLIYAHAGEQVVPAKANVGNGGGTNIHIRKIEVNEADNGEQVIDEMYEAINARSS